MSTSTLKILFSALKMIACLAVALQFSCSSLRPYELTATELEYFYIVELRQSLSQYCDPNIKIDEWLFEKKFREASINSQSTQERLSRVNIFIPSRQEFRHMNEHKTRGMAREVMRDLVANRRFSRKDASLFSGYLASIQQEYEMAGLVSVATDVPIQALDIIITKLHSNLKSVMLEITEPGLEKNIKVVPLSYGDGFRCVAWGIKGAVIGELDNWEKVDFNIVVHRTNPPRVVVTGFLSMAVFGGVPARTSSNWELDDLHELELDLFFKSVINKTLTK